MEVGYKLFKDDEWLCSFAFAFDDCKIDDKKALNWIKALLFPCANRIERDGSLRRYPMGTPRGHIHIYDRPIVNS